jgi:hypothetical protein
MCLLMGQESTLRSSISRHTNDSEDFVALTVGQSSETDFRN